MFDPAILLSLYAAPPPQLPSMETPLAHERVLQSARGREASAHIERMASKFEADADRWLAELNGMRSRVEAAGSLGFADQEVLDKFTNLIEVYEKMADARSAGLMKVKKHSSRDIKKMFQQDASIAVALREGARRLIANEKRLVDNLLEYALFLRALRAGANKDSTGGPIFDNSKELSHYLDSLIA